MLHDVFYDTRSIILLVSRGMNEQMCKVTREMLRRRLHQLRSRSRDDMQR
jgi:hypothetical protein